MAKKAKAKAKKAAKKKAAPAKKKKTKKAAKKVVAKGKAKGKAAAKPKAKAKAKAAPRAKAAAPAAAAPASGDSRAKLQGEILAMAKDIYGNRSDAELLALDPNDIDEMDPSIFYELLAERYGVASDPDNDYFGGYGGPISKTIDFIASRWDGKTNKSTPMPPGDWLEEYVHPATAEKLDDNAN
jgi:hypothetical protein